MSDLLSIATTGVKAYARALETVGDNVANAANPGHVRRTVALAPAGVTGANGPLELDPPGGNGVRLTAIVRAADMFQADAVRRADGLVAALTVAGNWLSRIESAITGPASLEPPIADYFAALADLSADPASIPARATLLARADTMATRFRAAATDLGRLESDLGKAADIEARTLNGLTQALASLNAQLRRASPGGGAAAALQDARDQLIGQIGAIVAVDVRLDARGQASLRVPDSGGPLLVTGDRAQSVRLLPSGTGFELRVGPEGADDPAPPGNGSMAGLSVAAQRLRQAREGLDGLAGQLATASNAIHRAGVTLTGADGGDLFQTVAVVAVPARANGGEARISAVLAPGAPEQPLVLIYNGSSGSWTLSRPDMSASVAGPLPLTLDGMTADGAGPAANGDRYVLEPRRGAAALSLLVRSPEDIAAAQRFLAEAGTGNSGQGVISLSPGAPLDPPSTGPWTVDVLDGPLLEVRDSLGTLLATAVPGAPLPGDGFEVRVDGTVLPGDRFAIRRTPANSDAGGNALALLSARDSGGPGGTLGDRSDALVTAVAVTLAETRVRAEAAAAERNRLAEAWQEASGVDLNREATEMLRFQQAYQANARIIETARATFEALLAAVR